MCLSVSSHAAFGSFSRPQIATAVTYLHEQEVMHRDLKPENIKLLPKNILSFVGGGGGGGGGVGGGGGEGGRKGGGGEDDAPLVVKLLDFGLSKDVSGGGRASTFVGTAAYYAPEGP